MAVTVQIVSLGDDQYHDAEKAARRLTDSQPDFEFRCPPLALRDRLSGFRFELYEQKETMDTLKAHAMMPDVPSGAGTIGLVSRPIKGNVFAYADVSAKPYCAVVTTSELDRYTRSIQAYLCFHFVRWALKFLCPKLAAHSNFRTCLFDSRINKWELVDVLEKPALCDECMRRLQPHLDPSAPLDSRVKIASIDQLLSIVKEEHASSRVSSVIMKGGGVKGAALAGAVSVLMDNRYSRFCAPTTFVGTSAGAIVATFLAAGLNPTQLRNQLDRDFRSLLDPRRKWAFNIFRGSGLHSGDPIENWIESVLRSGTLKLGGAPLDPVRFSDIADSKRRLVVYAANRFGTLEFDSVKDRDVPVARAVRFSMSIPLFFTTRDHVGEEVFDGGLLNNYPVEVFRREETNAKEEFVAIYLTSGDRPTRRGRFMLLRLLSIILNQDEFVVVRQFRKATIVVDSSPIGTFDFDLSEIAKRLLENRGRLAALNFVAGRQWVRPEDIEAERNDLAKLIEQDRLVVLEEKKRKKHRRLKRAILGVSLVVGVFLWFFLGLPGPKAVWHYIMTAV